MKAIDSFFSCSICILGCPSLDDLKYPELTSHNKKNRGRICASSLNVRTNKTSLLFHIFVYYHFYFIFSFCNLLNPCFYFIDIELLQNMSFKNNSAFLNLDLKYPSDKAVSFYKIHKLEV